MPRPTIANFSVQITETASEAAAHERKIPRGRLETRLRAERHKHGLTIEQVAAATGVNMMSLTHLEKHLRVPSFPAAIRLARFYQVPVEELFADLLDPDA